MVHSRIDPFVIDDNITDMVFINYIIHECVDINEIDDFGRTYILSACSNNASIDIIKKLLNAGSDPNIQDILGATPIMYVINNRAHDALAPNPRSPLKTLKIVELLLEFGADPGIADMNGEIPLFLVNDISILDILHTLTDFDINHLDKLGRNVLFFPHTEKIYYALLDYGANPFKKRIGSDVYENDEFGILKNARIAMKINAFSEESMRTRDKNGSKLNKFFKNADPQLIKKISSILGHKNIRLENGTLS